MCKIMRCAEFLSEDSIVCTKGSRPPKVRNRSWSLKGCISVECGIRTPDTVMETFFLPMNDREFPLLRQLLTDIAGIK